MPLPSQTIPVQFRGLDTKTDPRQPAVPGDLTRAENVIYDHWPRLTKRNGFQIINPPIVGGGGITLASFKGQLFAQNPLIGLSYAQGALASRGYAEPVQLTTQPVVRNGYGQQTPDGAIHPAGISVYTYESIEAGSTVSRYTVMDTATQQPIVIGAQIGTAAVKPKPFALGNYVVILYWETSNSHLRYIAIPAASPKTPISAVDFATDPAAGNIWDATVIGGQYGSLFVTYANNAGANKITLKTLSPTLVLGSAVVPVTAETYSTCVSIFGDPSSLWVWVAYYTGAAVKAFAYDYGLLNVMQTFATLDAAPGTVRNIGGVASPSNHVAYVMYEVSAADTRNYQIKWNSISASGSVGPSVSSVARSVGLASKPFVVFGIIHVLVAYQGSIQPTYFLMVEGGASPVYIPTGKLAPGVGGGLTAKSILPEATQISAGVVHVPYLQADQIGSSGGVVFSQKGVQAATFDFLGQSQALEFSDQLYLTGAQLWLYDGAQVCEAGFHLFPEGITAAVNGGGAGTPDAGVHQYSVIWEWMDNYGNLHRSAPSTPVSATATGTTANITLTIPTLRITTKSTPISVVVYGTQANQSIFYRLTSITSPLLNSTTADTVTFAVTASDASIIGNEQIYTTGSPGEVENIAPPACSAIAQFKGRLFVVSSEDPYTTWFSKQAVPGFPAEFNDAFTLTTTRTGGAIGAIAALDDKLILLKEQGLSFTWGDGPAPNGTSNDFSTPAPIPTDAGCTNPRSVVSMPSGLMYQSQKGIYLLGRDLSVNYIGARVEAYNGYQVTAAVMLPGSRRIAFTLAGPRAMLVYDYLAGLWAVWTGLDAVSACTFQGKFAWLKSTMEIFLETPGQFTDAGNPINIGLTTSWLSFAGLSGFERVRHLIIRGDYRSPHILQVSIASDDNPGATQTASIVPATQLTPGAPFDVGTFDVETPFDGQFMAYEWRIHLAKQKVTNVQIILQETQAGPSYGEGLQLSGFAFEVAAKSGLHRVRAEQSF